MRRAAPESQCLARGARRTTHDSQRLVALEHAWRLLPDQWLGAFQLARLICTPRLLALRRALTGGACCCLLFAWA
eukprot:7145869-Lingulodinium_polyedra.AAC.1